MSQQKRDIYEFGPFRLDSDERVLRRGETILQLSPKVVETLILLVEAAGRVQSRDYLISSLWADSFVDEGSLTQNISILRKNLGVDENGRQYIETLPKRGYRFVGEVRITSKLNPDGFSVELVSDGTGGPHTPEAPHGSPLEAGFIAGAPENPEPFVRTELATASSLATPGRKFRARTMLIVLLVIGACVAAAVVSLRWERKVSSVSELRSIAILPFQDLSGESSEEYLGLGLTDSLITKLGNLPGLSVRPTSAVRKYKGMKADAVTVGKELNVEAVMEGTVQQISNRLRITVQLVRVSDGASLWSEKFDAEFTTLLAVEDSISEQVAMRLARDLGDRAKQQLKKQFTANPEAHRLYLQGRYFWSQRTAKSMNRAVETFGEAIKLDGNYALAHAGLADCYVTMGEATYSFLPPTEAFPKARVAAQRALDLDDSLAEAHTAMASVQLSYDWNLPAAQKSFQRALELNPRYPTALRWYGWYFVATRQFAEAEQMMLRAREQDPVSPVIAVEAGYPAFFAGDYDRALAQFSAAAELDADHPAVRFSLWRVYLQKRDYAKALQEIDSLEQSSGKSSYTVLIRGVTLAESGETAGARVIFDTLLAEKEKGAYVQPVLLAVLAADVNRLDEAFKLLNQSLTERNDIVFIPVAPEYRRLHSDPRYSDLMRRAGLEP